ncbi:MAG: CotH kinase family protein [Prevotellaceae bacterium]|nr:CotH kinase family protein [Prevotellaceae bacterium]
MVHRLLLFIALSLSTLCGQAQVVNFSPKGMFQTEAFELSLQPSNSKYQIYYTLDGTRPTKENAMLYSSPIKITTTTPVSAVCVDVDGVEYGIMAKTYIFLKDVYKQPANPEGYPENWSRKDSKTYWKGYYKMDTSVTESDEYRDLMDDAMMAIPTVCITTNIDYLFSASDDENTGGIYVHTGKDASKVGDGWERPASIEYFDPETGGKFQLNCGLLLHGGNSRNPQNSAKHSFRVSFRKEYGEGKLKFKLFEDDDAVQKFDHLVLRAGYNYTWIKNGSKSMYPQNIVQRTNAQYIYDSWAKEVQHAMGHLFTHRRFCHLYLNNLYWGLYEICEKINDNFASAYLGGEDEDYDVIDVNEMIDGTRDAYTTMYNTAMKVGAKANDNNYTKLQTNHLLDIENYIDYMLINWYIGNDDWDNNNWRCIRSRVNPGDGFKYLVWDAETAFTDVNYNKVEKKNGNPTAMMEVLKKNPDFKKTAQERIACHLTGDGILTPHRAAQLYSKIADEIDLPIICESARWGGYRVFTGESEETYTRNDHWLPHKQDLLENYFPKRTENMLSYLTKFGLFDPTRIEHVNDVNAIRKPTDAVYDLQGRKVSTISSIRTLPPGVYIHAEKKFCVESY